MYCYACSNEMAAIGPGIYQCELCGTEIRDTSRKAMLQRCCPVSRKTMKHASSVPDSIFLTAKSGRITRLPPRDNVREICFSDGICIIEKRALEGFRNLENVSFPNTLAEVRKRAFYGCKKLHIAYLPFATKKIGKKAFRKTKVHLHVPPPFAHISPTAFPKNSPDPQIPEYEDE